MRCLHMSWQRIFETARKQGIPVIVTDGAGRDPLVILPLDQFEALTESTVKEPKIEPTPESLRPEPTIAPPDEKKLVSELMPGLSNEERFYLEPVEDSWSEPRV